MLGQAYLRAADYQAVTRVFGRIMAIDPNSAEAHVMMGTAYDKMFQQTKAVEEYEAAEHANANFSGVHSGLGLLYWKRDEIDRAQAEFHEELLRFPSDPVANCFLGQIAIRRNKLVEALPLFQLALAANPEFKEALFGLGKVQTKLGHPADALDPLRKAIKLDPEYAEAHYQLGNALALLGRTDEARKERSISASIQTKQAANYAKRLREEQ
jgi:tetratricopeptide (TPR) repeat protein